MGHEHRLGVLHVRAPGHDRLPRALGLGHEGVDDVEQPAADVAGLVAQVHPDEGGNLVVARTPGTQLPAKFRTGAFDEAALEAGVDVLVVGPRAERTRGDVVVEKREGGKHPGQLGVGQEAGLMQGASVRARASDIVACQAPVKVSGAGKLGQCVRGRATKTAAP